MQVLPRGGNAAPQADFGLMRTPAPTLWLWGTLFCVVGLAGARLELHRRQATDPQGAAIPIGGPLSPQLASAASLEPTPLMFPSPAAVEEDPPSRAGEAHRVIADTIGADDSIYLALKRHGVLEQQIARLNASLETVFDPRTRSRPGDVFALQLDTAEAVLHFAYTPARSPESPICVELRDGELLAREVKLELETRTSAIEVTIVDNLSNAVGAAGEGDVLTDLLADIIFGSVIDFHRDPRRGDRLSLVVDKLYRDGEFVRYDRVHLAKYDGEVVSQLAVYHEASDSRGGYYDESGASIERLFMLQPLSYRRISGRFSRSRFHPILKRNRPHLGTDFAAALGTDVWATARGRVVRAGWNGGLGKLVEIEHANGYRTRYAHLSRIAVRPGQAVNKRDLIGRVGATGLATGPHLHYELLRNGRHLNPTSANRTDRGAPLAEADRERFAARRDELMDMLGGDRTESPTMVSAKTISP